MGPDSCMWVDPYAKGNTYCPEHCNEDQMWCPGTVDDYGNSEPEFCIPMNQECPTFCPTRCGSQEMLCHGGMDANGCPMPDTCMWMDPYCPTNCPANCMEDEILCHGGYDSSGQCPYPDSCMPAKSGDFGIIV